MNNKYGKLEWYGRSFMILASRENVTAMKKSCIAVQREAKKLTGKGGGKPHVPSLPSDPPRRDTGILTNSISYSVDDYGTNVEGAVGVDVTMLESGALKFGGTGDVDYGFYLEVGTKFMEARPFLRPALRNMKKTILRFFRAAFA